MQLHSPLSLVCRSPLESQKNAQICVWLDVIAVNQHASCQKRVLNVGAVKAVLGHSLRGMLLMLDSQQTAMSRMW